MKLAYFTNQYPKISHTFIRNEICALERSGVEITRFAIRRANEALTDPADLRELARAEILLERGAAEILKNLSRTALRRPFAFAKALRTMLKMGWRSQRGLARHFVYLAEACLLQTLCAERGITHVHGHHGTNPAAVALLCKMLGGPSYSLTVHGPEEFEDNARLALDLKIANAEFVVSVSEWGRAQLMRRCEPAQHAKIFVVRHSIDEKYFDVEPAPVPNTVQLVWVGRLAEQKDPLLLVRAIEKLGREHVSCTVSMFGDGPLRAVLEKEIARCGLERVIALRGWANRKQILDVLQKSRALVLSSYAENTPSVILEAFAQARPVVSTNVGSVAELVRDGATGWLVPPGDADGLARALRSVLETGTASLSEMGKTGRRFVQENFDADTQARQLRALFNHSRSGPFSEHF